MKPPEHWTSVMEVATSPVVARAVRIRRGNQSGYASAATPTVVPCPTAIIHSGVAGNVAPVIASGPR